MIVLGRAAVSATRQATTVEFDSRRQEHADVDIRDEMMGEQNPAARRATHQH